jgi:hypothetical protein
LTPRRQKRLKMWQLLAIPGENLQAVCPNASKPACKLAALLCSLHMLLCWGPPGGFETLEVPEDVAAAGTAW